MRRILFFLLFLACQQSLMAVDDGEAAARLSALGFENVRVADYGRGTVFASFEATGYRGTYYGAAAGLRELARLYPEAGKFRVFLLEDQLPRVALTASVVDGQWTVAGDYDLTDYETALRIKPQVNGSAAKFDLTVFPMFSWINHRFNQAFEYVVSIAPALQTSLWPGNRIILQPVIPVSYDVQSINSEAYVHVGVANIAQDLTFGHGRFTTTLTGGFFLYDRLGFDLRVGWRATPCLTLSAEGSITGEALVRDGHYDIGPLKKISALAKADYYEPRTRLQAQLTAGRFVFGDYGVRADISRHFGDYTIGLYGIYTGGEDNVGFHFAIPFGPKHYARKGAFRVKLPDYYDLEYNQVSAFKYYDEQMGQTLEVRPDENRSAHYWQAVHVAQYTEKVLNNQLRIHQ